MQNIDQGANVGFKAVRNMASDRPVLIVLSHLRWGFVFQRPQHLMTRLARHFTVLFVEEPVHAEGTAQLRSTLTTEGVEVLTPHTPSHAAGFHDEQLPTIGLLLADLMLERDIVDPFVWLYTPMALPLVGDLEPRAVIYDCMDDLASFKFAPPALVEREAALMSLADVVLTGGPSLYEKRRHLHPSVHCLPSAVDVEHFAARNLRADSAESTASASLHEGLAHPRIGFFGVIDERLDIDLVAALADLRPDWQIVMVGPVVKIDPATLPRRDNIRWLGMQSYAMLPHLQAQWDVCMLPFALNEATRFISPTKTLEYLAGSKPVVSTPILDVQTLYGSVVRIAADAAGFANAIEEAMTESPEVRESRRTSAQALVDDCTWDATAATIHTLMADYVRPAVARPVQTIDVGSTTTPTASAAQDRRLPVAVPPRPEVVPASARATLAAGHVPMQASV